MDEADGKRHTRWRMCNAHRLQRVRADRRNAELVRHRYHKRLATGRILDRRELGKERDVILAEPRAVWRNVAAILVANDSGGHRMMRDRHRATQSARMRDADEQCKDPSPENYRGECSALAAEYSWHNVSPVRAAQSSIGCASGVLTHVKAPTPRAIAHRQKTPDCAASSDTTAAPQRDCERDSTLTPARTSARRRCCNNAGPWASARRRTRGPGGRRSARNGIPYAGRSACGRCWFR